MRDRACRRAVLHRFRTKFAQVAKSRRPAEAAEYEQRVSTPAAVCAAADKPPADLMVTPAGSGFDEVEP
jgi:hypothetical protein